MKIPSIKNFSPSLETLDTWRQRARTGLFGTATGLALAGGVEVLTRKEKTSSALLLGAATALSILALGVDRAVCHAIEQKVKTEKIDLFTALEAKNLQQFRILLERGANVRQRGKGKFIGCEPLHAALLLKNFEAVQLLIERGADPNSIAGIDPAPLPQLTPLDLANKSPQIFRYLLEKGADPLKAGRKISRTTLLHEAVSREDEEIVQALVEKGFAPLLATQENLIGETPLDFVIEKGNLRIARLLVEGGADILAKTDFGTTTPLHKATEMGRLAIANLLLDFRPEAIDAKDEYGQSPLAHLLLTGGSFEAIRLLIERGAIDKPQNVEGDTPIHLAAATGRLDVVQFLIEKGVDRQAQDRQGRTPLHYAAAHDRLDVVQFLVEVGVDLAIEDNQGKIACEFAKEGAAKDFLSFLTHKVLQDEIAKDIITLPPDLAGVAASFLAPPPSQAK